MNYIINCTIGIIAAFVLLHYMNVTNPLIAFIGVFLVIAVKEGIVKIIKGHKAP